MDAHRHSALARLARFPLKRASLGLSPTIALFILLLCFSEARIISPQEDELWLGALKSERRAERLAAGILLSATGDPQGTDVFMQMFPSMSAEEQSFALDYFVQQSDLKRLDPRIIDAYQQIKIKSEYRTLMLIPPGSEARHLNSLREALERRAQEENLHAFWWTAYVLSQTDDLPALEACNTHIQKNIQRDSRFPWVWARVLARLYKQNPLQGLEVIENECRESVLTETRNLYLRELGLQEHHQQAIDLWIALSAENQEGNREPVDWEHLWAHPLRTLPPLGALVRGIANYWNRIPEEQKERFSAEERERFHEAFSQCVARYMDFKDERGMATQHDLRGMYIREYRPFYFLRREDVPELRGLLIDQALTAQHTPTARQAVQRLQQHLGGIPQDVKDHLLKRLEASPDALKNRFSEESILMNVLTGYSVRNQLKPFVSFDAGRRRMSFPQGRPSPEVRRALRSLENAISSYSSDYSVYPVTLDMLTGRSSSISNETRPIPYSRNRFRYGVLLYQHSSFVITIPGPDQAWDISPIHFVMSLQLDIELLREFVRQGPWVSWTPAGYVFSDVFVRGCDYARKG